MSEPFATSEIRHHFLCCWSDEAQAKYGEAFDAWLSGFERDVRERTLIEAARIAGSTQVAGFLDDPTDADMASDARSRLIRDRIMSRISSDAGGES